MTLQEILTAVRNSTSNDWHTPTTSGNAFRYSLEWGQRNGVDFIEPDEHSVLAVLKSNIAVSISFGLEENDDFVMPWANVFADANASRFYFDIFYNGWLVYRSYVVSVDGHRAYLPSANHASQTTAMESDFARLATDLNASREYDRYFQQSGITITEDQPEL